MALCVNCSLQSDLNKHLRTHTGVEIFTCDECVLCFAQSGTMTVHTAQGSCALIGDKPFKRDLCDLHFALNSRLKLHVPSHQPVQYDNI